MATPDLRTIFAELAEARIRYVLTGSVAAAVYGVPAEPPDVDIAPDLSPDNLQRLSDLLRRWEAKPRFVPEWTAMTAEDCASWTPEPTTLANLDHLFETPHGRFCHRHPDCTRACAAR